MDKEVVYIHNRILFSHKRERNLAIHDNMDESRRHDVKGNKSDRERELPYDFTLCVKFKTRNNKNQKQNHKNRELVVAGRQGARRTNKIGEEDEEL